MWINLTGLTPDPVFTPTLRRTNEARAARIYQGWRALRRGLGAVLRWRRGRDLATVAAPQRRDAADAQRSDDRKAAADPAPARPALRSAA